MNSNEALISKVENNLSLPILVRGENPVALRLTDRMQHHLVPALGLAVIDQDEVAWSRAYGVIQAGRADPVTVETRFQAASISKPVTALAALRLVAEGRLDLDTDVNHYLRSWRLSENHFTRERPVTVRGLLTHSAGLTVHGFPGYPLAGPVPSLAQVLDGLPPTNTAAIRVDKRPGDEWRYSGGGFTVLQQLLMDLTGQEFEDLMRELVFEPVGMAHSTFQLQASGAAHLAHGHNRDGAPVPGGWMLHPESAAAGLWSTPTDLARFGLAMLRAAQGAPGAVLPQPLAEAALAVQFGNWGLGFARYGEGPKFRFGHGGDNVGFKCDLFVYRERGLGAVLMTNGDRGDPLIAEVVRSLLAAYDWPDFPPKEKVLGPASPDAWARLAGKYALVDVPNVLVTIAVAADRLRLTLAQTSGTFIADLWPEQSGRFFRREADFEIEFGPDVDGLTASLMIYQNGGDFRAARVPEGA